MQHVIGSHQFMKEEFPFRIFRTEQRTSEGHSHDFVELVYVVNGKGIHHFAGSSYDIQFGDVFIINPGEIHSYSVEPGESMDIINCLFMPAFISDTLLHELEISGSMDYFYMHPFLQNELRFNHRLNLHGQDATLVLAVLENMIRENGYQSSGYRVLIRLQLIELLLLLSRKYSHMQKKHISPSPQQLEREMIARRIYGYLERSYDKKITLESLSLIFNVSIRQLNRIMRQEFNSSVINVLHEIRIKRAKHLLATTDDKIISIAIMVGYEDPSFFCNLFLRYVRSSPSQYRNSLVDHQMDEDVRSEINPGTYY